MNYISLRQLLLENITPQPDWFHVSFSTFQDSQGRRYSRGKDGQYKETSDSIKGKRWPAPTRNQTDIQPQGTRGTPYAQRALTHPTDTTQGSSSASGPVRTSTELLTSRGIAHSSSNVTNIVDRFREIFAQNNNAIPDITTPMTALSQAYGRNVPAPIYRVNPNPFSYPPDSKERAVSKILSQGSSYGLWYAPLDVIIINETLGEEVTNLSIDTWTAEHVNSFSTYVHETLHSAMTKERDSLYEMGVRYIEVPCAQIIEEGMTEYISQAIISGIIEDDAIYEEYMEGRKLHPYEPWVNAIGILANRGGFNIDFEWRDTSMVTDYSDPRGPVPRINTLLQAKNSQRQALTAILTENNISNDRIQKLVNKASMLWDNAQVLLARVALDHHNIDMDSIELLEKLSSSDISIALTFKMPIPPKYEDIKSIQNTIQLLIQLASMNKKSPRSGDRQAAQQALSTARALERILNTTKAHFRARDARRASEARRAKEKQNTAQPISGQQASINQP